jgi:hypothetical protein
MDAALSAARVVNAKKLLGQLQPVLQKLSADRQKMPMLLGNIILAIREFAPHQAANS